MPPTTFMGLAALSIKIPALKLIEDLKRTIYTEVGETIGMQ